MAFRLIAIARSKLFISAGLMLAGYALAGFFLVPFLIGWYLPRYAQEQLQRQAAIGEVHVNPLLFTFEAKDFELREADGRPILEFQRLFVDFELVSLFRCRWTFKEISLNQPALLVHIGPTGELNLAALARSFLQLEEAEEPVESGLPRLLIHHLTLSQGRVTVSDESDPTHASVLFEPIDLELDAVSTLPERAGRYALRAQLPNGGGGLGWSGELSLKPLQSSGRFELAGIKPATAWRFFQDELNLAEPQGTFDLHTNYRVAFDRGFSQLLLEDLSVVVTGSVLRLEEAAEPMLSLESLRLGEGRLDFLERDATFGTLTIGPGHVQVELDSNGSLNWQQLIRLDPKPKPAEPPLSRELEKPWKISLSSVQLDGLSLRYEDATRKAPLCLKVGSIAVAFAVALEAGAAGITGRLSQGQLTLARIQLAERASKAALATLDKVQVEDWRVDLGARDLHAKRLRLQGGAVQVAREKNGRIHPLTLLAPATTRSQAKAEGNPWSLALDSLQLEDFTLALADRSLEPAPLLDIVAQRVALSDLRNDGKTPAGFEADLAIKQGGSINVTGRLAPNFENADAQLTVAQLSLSPLAAYVTHFTTLQLAAGEVSTTGQFVYAGGGPAPSVRYTGALSVTDLLLNEAASGKRFLAWRSLSTDRFSFGLAPDHLDIAEVRVLQPEAKIILFKDRRVNLAEILKDRGEGDAGGKAEASEPASWEDAPFPVTVAKLRVERGEVDFADFSLALPFAAHIRDLVGVVGGISSKSASKTSLRLEGRVDPYGFVQLVGLLQPFQPKTFTDLNVRFLNVQTPPLTPYSATFVGRTITSGTLDLDLDYRIERGQLVGKNEVTLKDFTLGERVKSPRAIDLPLDLAIALLTDPQGRIRLAVPVWGDTGDPRFDYGEVIRQTFVSLITKTVTAPFRTLGAMFGGRVEVLKAMAFEPGSFRLLPPEQEKLVYLAQALRVRPQLGVVVQGRFEERLDGEALRNRQVRLALAQELGITVAPGESLGPINFDDARTQVALEALLAARGGPDALAAFEAEYEKSTGAEVKRVNRWLWRFGRASSDTAFYEAVFERLVELEPLSPSDLMVLAKRRGEAIVKALADSGVRPDQIVTGAPGLVKRRRAEMVEIPLRLTPIGRGG